MTELSSILVNKNLNAADKDQVGYVSLFEKDFMEFPNRINRDVNGRSFQVVTGTGTLSGDKWNAHEEKSIEQVAYYSPKDQKDPSKIITKVEYEGWRRYVEERRPTEGGRIIFHVRGLQKQSTLARIIDDKSFKEIGWMEPIVAVTEDPILAVNFRENAIEDNPDYIDDLFSRVRQLEALPNEIMVDLKNVIALNSIDRFMKRMIESGFSEYEFEEYLKQIRPSALKGVASPFYAAALFSRKKGRIKEARKSLKKIKKTHWQYEAARDLERSLYEQEIRENKDKYEQVIHELKNEVVHLRSRGSIADKDSSVQATLTTTKSDEIQLQHKTESENKVLNAKLAQRLATKPGTLEEIIPQFKSLRLLSRQKDIEQPKKPENSPKTQTRQRVPS